jgi:hypothetical protein
MQHLHAYMSPAAIRSTLSAHQSTAKAFARKSSLSAKTPTSGPSRCICSSRTSARPIATVSDVWGEWTQREEPSLPEGRGRATVDVSGRRSVCGAGSVLVEGLGCGVRKVDGRRPVGGLRLD